MEEPVVTPLPQEDILAEDPLWLAALHLLKRVNQRENIRTVWETWIPVVRHELHHHAVSIGPDFAPAGNVPTVLWVNQPHWFHLPEIERLEILLYAACGGWWEINRATKYQERTVFEGEHREAWEHLCRRAGCYWGTTSDVAARWLKIDYYTPVHLMPIAPWETRPMCRVCHTPIATGSFAASPKSGQEIPWHKGCLTFAHRFVQEEKLEIRPRKTLEVL